MLQTQAHCNQGSGATKPRRRRRPHLRRGVDTDRPSSTTRGCGLGHSPHMVPPASLLSLFLPLLLLAVGPLVASASYTLLTSPATTLPAKKASAIHLAYFRPITTPAWKRYGVGEQIAVQMALDAINKDPVREL